MSKWTVGRLKEILSKHPDDMPVGILFECTEALPDGFQYQVPVLDVINTGKSILFAHEEDYEGHYSKDSK